MKKLPEVRGSWKSFYELTTYSVKSTVFMASLKLKIYDYMQNWSTPEEIAWEAGCNKRNLELILNALAGMDIVIKSNGKFVNSPESQEFLVSDKDTWIGDFLLHVSAWNNLTEEDYVKLVKQGPPAESPDISEAGLWAKSAKLSAPYQYTGAAQRVAGIISSVSDFRNMKRMMDLGGGSGFYSMAVAELHPEIQVVVFDQPEVTEVAKEFICQYDMEHRVSVLPGDYMTDSFQNTYDLILASATLNFVKKDLNEIVQKIYDALEPGGYFVSHADGLLKERTHPVNFISEFLVGELMGNDFGFPSGMIGNAMAETGFIHIRSFFVDSDSGEMEITIGRKGK